MRGVACMSRCAPTIRLRTVMRTRLALWWRAALPSSTGDESIVDQANLTKPNSA